jgi:hypothetical protein
MLTIRNAVAAVQNTRRSQPARGFSGTIRHAIVALVPLRIIIIRDSRKGVSPGTLKFNWRSCSAPLQQKPALTHTSGPMQSIQDYAIEVCTMLRTHAMSSAGQNDWTLPVALLAYRFITQYAICVRAVHM